MIRLACRSLEKEGGNRWSQNSVDGPRTYMEKLRKERAQLSSAAGQSEGPGRNLQWPPSEVSGSLRS